MIDVARLQHVVHQAWLSAYRARYKARIAHERALCTMQEVQRAYHRTHMACLALSMPEANPITLTTTATILASHGLLDQQSPRRPPVRVTRLSAWPTLAALG